MDLTSKGALPVTDATEKKTRTPPELRWIDQGPELPASRPMDFEPVVLQGGWDRLITKTQENLLVPLGLIATATCLTMGLVNMKKGDRLKQQMYMRGRIGFQAFTLAAMSLGVLFTSKKSKSDHLREIK